MSQRDLKRLHALRGWTDGGLTQREVARQLGLCERQIRRLIRRLEQGGAGGLIDRRRGQPSNRRIGPEVLGAALDLVSAHYSDFGPTFANEKLREEHGIRLGTETLRRAMIQAQLWQPHQRRSKKPHPSRARRPCFGELIQIDGSSHDWFEGRAPRCSLLVFIDDATSRLVGLRFVERESTEGYFELGLTYMQRYGRPMAMYSDRHSIFRAASTTRNDGTTQFSRALDELEIELICATTPQAKGRVERANRTLQQRLPRELRLRNISSIATANAYLADFIDGHNRRFGRTPASGLEAHRPAQPEQLEDALCAHYTRQISKDGLVNIDAAVFALEDDSLRFPTRVTVLHRGRRGFELRVGGRTVAYHRLRSLVEQSQIRSAKELEPHLDRRHEPGPNPRKAHTPPPGHPWRRKAIQQHAPTR